MAERSPLSEVRLDLARALGGLLVLRIACGLTVAALSPGFPERYDGDDYRDLAASVSAGQGLSISRVRWFEAPRPEKPTPEAFRPPLLPLLAGWLARVEPDSYGRLLAFQAALATLLAGAVAFVLLDVAGARAAWAGLVLSSLHPLLALYSVHFSTEILFSLCLAAFLWAWLREGPWRWPAVGLATAFATLARPTALLLLPLSVAAVLRVERRGGRLRGAALLAAGFLLAMSPWMLRNQALFGEPRLTGYFGGYIFWLGNNRSNLEAYEAERDREFLRHQRRAFDESIKMAQGLLDPRYRHPREQEAFWFERAWADVREYGYRRWLGLLSRKAWHFWRPWPLRVAHGRRGFWVVAASETALFAAGGWGMLMLWKRRSPAVTPLFLLLAAGTAAHSLTFSHMRHRVPFVDLVLIVCAGAVAGLSLPARVRRAAGSRSLPGGQPPGSAATE